MPSKNNITVLLCGGLGNQLFQYAYGRAIAQENDYHLRLDAVNLFDRDTRYGRTYCLDAFNLCKDISVIHRPIPCFKLKLKARSQVSKLMPAELSPVCIEGNPNAYSESSSPANLRTNTWIFGYWQCERYFDAYRDVIKQDLEFHTNVIAPQRPESNTCQVSVHVRRADYANALPMDYYLQAIDMMRQRLKNPSFLVFTDDPIWWREHGIKASDINLFEDAGMSPIQVFAAMRDCDHFIIANSSFSWWAAWLGHGDEGLVICPSSCLWFNHDSPAKDWLQIEA